jgi:hypothetical protein
MFRKMCLKVITGTFVEIHFCNLYFPSQHVGIFSDCQKSYRREVKVKGKVVPAYLIEHYAMEAYCGSAGIAPRIV